MQGDIFPYDEGLGYVGENTFQVTNGTTAQKINAGEPVYLAINQQFATAAATATPTSADLAHTWYGIATSNSTDTVANTGTVKVMPIYPWMTFLVDADVPATYGYTAATGVVVQATYDALVGKWMQIILTGTAALKTAKYTINATHNAANGLIIMPMDVAKYPGKVRFAVRLNTTYFGGALSLG